MAGAPLLPGDDPIVAVVERIAAPGAFAVVDVGRDETDGFRVEARATGSVAVPARDALIALVPAGSRWTDAVGWASIYGGPLVTSTGTAWAIGVAIVQPRPGGGAVPRVRAYLHAGSAGGPFAARLDEMAAELDPTGAKGRADALATKIVVRALPGARVGSSRPEQAALLRMAAAAWRSGARPVFRTVALSEAELVPVVDWRPRLPPGADRAIIGVADALSRRYSLATLLRVLWRCYWQPY